MDWIIVAGLMAISLVLALMMLSLNDRMKSLEKEIKRMRGLDQELPIVDRLYKELESEVKEQYNQSYGNPDYTEWIDQDYDSKGVK